MEKLLSMGDRPSNLDNLVISKTPNGASFHYFRKKRCATPTFTPDGEYILAAGNDPYIRIYRTGQVLDKGIKKVPIAYAVHANDQAEYIDFNAVNRRNFIQKSLIGSVASTGLLQPSLSVTSVLDMPPDPVIPDLKKKITSPVIIQSVALLKVERNYFIVTKSTAGVTGISKVNSRLQNMITMFKNQITPISVPPPDWSAPPGSTDS